MTPFLLSILTHNPKYASNCASRQEAKPTNRKEKRKWKK